MQRANLIQSSPQNKSKGYFCCLSLLVHLNLFQIITLEKGATMKNEGSHAILKKGGLLKQRVGHDLMRKGALRLDMFLLRIHTGHHAMLQFLLTLSMAILWLVITTDIINQHLHLSLGSFLLF
ncbi:DCD (Development and Cell Death) domain protein [Zea mays]|uniref:DCD (Development and Cell Death) domain protein n=1 Tax=Zea mays TaxID=4577 RepID=A0A1D6LVR3_MAIZE|nr:DCD (Development and Cell Death) domain protein [Zea mays]